MKLQLGDIATVKYSCYLPDDDDDASSSSSAPFAQSTKQKMVVGDGSMIDGWEKAIRTMRVGERSLVRINNPNLAYGATGVAPIIPPNAIVELDLEILDATEPTANIDFDNLALDTTPTTAADIARAFEQRQAIAAAKAGPKLEGL
jgi:FKBP-type peptidyl-prolyl cis-trans isomerase